MGTSLQSLLGAEHLGAFESAGTVACGLPGAAYTSEAFFALENERIFADSWVFVGFAHELPRPATWRRRPWPASQYCWCATRRGRSAPFTTCVATAT